MSNLVLIVEAEDGWHVGLPGQPSTRSPPPTDSSQVVGAIQELFDERDVRSCEAYLAVGSRRSLTDSFGVRSPRSVSERDLLAFQFEEQLPIEAEALVTDFVVRGSEVFAVAVETAVYLPLVRELHESGIPVIGIAPAATLIVQELASQLAMDNGFIHFEGPFSEEELFQIRDSRPARWWTKERSNVPDNVFKRALLAATIETTDPQTLYSTSSLESLALGSDADLFQHGSIPQSDIKAALFRAVQKITLAKMPPWISLRRDALLLGDRLREVRWPLRVLAASMLLLLFAAASALTLRAHRYQLLTQELQASQQQLFSYVLPQTTVSSGAINSRLRSHLRALHETRDVRADQQTGRGFGVPRSTFYALQRFLMAMSVAGDFELETVAMKGDTIDVDLVVGSFEEVNQIVDVLRTHGFEISPPASTQQGNRVRSRIMGALKDPMAQQSKITARSGVSR